MPSIRTNTVKKKWPFRVMFADGRIEEITVESDSYHNAVYSLPSGKKHYEYLGRKKKEDNQDG